MQFLAFQFIVRLVEHGLNKPRTHLCGEEKEPGAHCLHMCIIPQLSRD